MGNISSIIVPGAKLGLVYTERLLADVTPANYARFARPGAVEIKSNHPAFVLGHLTLYPARVMQCLNQPEGPTACPSHYEDLFKNGVECQDDPDGSIYPPLDELKKCFVESYEAAIAAVESAEDDAFGHPNPGEGRIREMFPTVGAAVAFYLIGHVQVHLGQFSTWRRAMQLPPA
jgi:hypothetical protein